MPRSSGGSLTSGFPWKADSPKFVDDGRTRAGDGRVGSERCSARNPRSSVTAMASITASLSSRTAAADRSLEAPPQVTAMGQSDALPRTPHGQGNGSRQRFGVVPPGLGRVGDECSFPAWGLRDQPTICLPIRVLAEPREITLHASRLQLQGPGVNLQRGTAMKPRKTSSATNETRSARPSFRLDPQCSGYGPILPQGTSRKPKTGRSPRSHHLSSP